MFVLTRLSLLFSLHPVSKHSLLEPNFIEFAFLHYARTHLIRTGTEVRRRGRGLRHSVAHERGGVPADHCLNRTEHTPLLYESKLSPCLLSPCCNYTGGGLASPVLFSALHFLFI